MALRTWAVTSRFENDAAMPSLEQARVRHAAHYSRVAEQLLQRYEVLEGEGDPEDLAVRHRVEQAQIAAARNWIALRLGLNPDRFLSSQEPIASIENHSAEKIEALLQADADFFFLARAALAFESLSLSQSMASNRRIQAVTQELLDVLGS